MADGFLDKLKTVIGLESGEIEETEEEPRRKKKLGKEHDKSTVQRDQTDQRDTYSYRSNTFSLDRQHNRDIGGKVVNINANISQMKVVLLQPSSIEECPKIVDNLKSKRPVIVNLNNLDTDIARKIFDFISGAVYALDGNVQKVANNIFIFAPDNVDVMGSLDKEESNLLFNTNQFNNWR